MNLIYFIIYKNIKQSIPNEVKQEKIDNLETKLIISNDEFIRQRKEF